MQHLGDTRLSDAMNHDHLFFCFIITDPRRQRRTLTLLVGFRTSYSSTTSRFDVELVHYDDQVGLIEPLSLIFNNWTKLG